jgi:hypothetical protein
MANIPDIRIHVNVRVTFNFPRVTFNFPQNLMFVSKEVADRLSGHQRLVKDFANKANPLRDEGVQDVLAFTTKMAQSLAELQSKMMDEIRNRTDF